MKNSYSFVRHGKTKFNENGGFMGLLDIPLSLDGIQQALTLKNTLRSKAFDIVYTSPLIRAYHTAMISLGIAEPYFLEYEDKDKYLSFIISYAGSILNGRSFLLDQRLAERSFGDLQGHSKKDYTEKFPKYNGREIEKSFTDKPDGGENFADLELRLCSFFNEVESQYKNKDILIFSHNGPILIARKYFEGLSEEETLKISNPHCEIIQFEDKTQDSSIPRK